MPKKLSAVPFYMAGIVVLAVIGGGVAYFQKEDLDTDTGCAKTGPKSTTIIMIDTSDPFSPIQEASLRRFIRTLITPPKHGERITANSDSANYVEKGHLLVAYRIMKDDETAPELLFRSCNPGNPDDRTFVDKLTEGKTLAVLKWADFENNVIGAIPQGLGRNSSPTSPIIETLKYVRGVEFPSPADLKSSGRNAGSIFIVSDMLQHSRRLSHYRELLPAVEVPSRFALDLTGIDIGVRYLKVRRYAHLQYGARPHFRWWREFFAAAGAPLNKPPDFW